MSPRLRTLWVSAATRGFGWHGAGGCGRAAEPPPGPQKARLPARAGTDYFSAGACATDFALVERIASRTRGDGQAAEEKATEQQRLAQPHLEMNLRSEPGSLAQLVEQRTARSSFIISSTSPWDIGCASR